MSKYHHTSERKLISLHNDQSQILSLTTAYYSILLFFNSNQFLLLIITCPQMAFPLLFYNMTFQVEPLTDSQAL